MPAFVLAAALSGAGAGAVAVAAGTATFWAAFIPAFATASILGGLSKALAKKPALPAESSPSVFSSQGRDVTVRQPISPWKVVVGESKEGGVLTAAWLSSDKRYFHVVVTLACHQCQAIGDVYLDDKIVTSAMLDGAGNVTSGDYATTAPVARVYSGTVPASPYQITVDHTVSSVQSVSVQQEVALGGDDGTQVQDVALLEGSNYTRSGATFTFDSSFEGLPYTVNYTENTTVSNLRIQKSLGGEAYGTQPFPDFVTESEGYWTATDRQDGHCKMYLRFAVAALDGALPTMAAVVQGMLHYDPRTSTTVYSANPALALSSYLCNTEFGLGATFADEIDSDALEAAANLCDENVTLAAGGTEDRYTCNGSFLTSERPGDIIEKLLGCMAGRAAHISDKWHLFAGGYEAPTVTLDAESELVSAVDIDPMPANNEWANGAKGVFVDPDNHYQPTDFPAVVSATYLSQDGGVRRWVDLDLTSFTNSSSMAQRLAKIELLRRRNALRFTGTWRLSAWRALTARTVAVDFAKYGWSGQVFEVTGSRFVVIPGEGDSGPTLGVELSLRQTAAAIYDWATNEEQAQPVAPATQLPDPFAVPSVEAPTVTETMYETTGSAGVKVRLDMRTSAVQAAANYEFRYKKADAADYRVLPRAPTPAAVIDDVADGLYLFSARAYNTFGRAGSWATTAQLILGLSAPPADVEEFTLTPLLDGQCELAWKRHADLDVRIGGQIQLRFSPLTTTPGWNDCAPLDAVPGGLTSAKVPMRTGTYRARAVDSGGRPSANSVYVITTEPDLAGYNAVETVTAEPDWAGTKSHTWVKDGKLRLGSGRLVSEMTAAMSTWGQIVTLGGVASEGTITLDEVIDLAAVYTSRLTLALETLSFNTDDKVSQWLQPMSTWGLLSGPEIATTGCEIFVATTEDDPSGAPTWSDWSPFVVGLYRARGFKFKARLRSGNSEHNIEISALEVTIDMPDRDQALDFTTSSGGDTTVTWTLSPAFKATPKLGVTMKNMATGDYHVITSEAASGFVINAYNSAGTRVVRNGTARGKAY